MLTKGKNTKFFPTLLAVAATGIFLSLSPILPYVTIAQTTSSWGDGFATPYYMTSDGSISPNGKWLDVYGGYGLKGVTTEILSTGGTNGYFFEYPKTSTSPGESHSTLTTSTTSFGDFQMTLYMKTVKQLRQNSPPNTWETAWVFWHYKDESHFYALVLKTNGLQIEKKDGSTQELYLLENPNFPVHLGQWQKLTLEVTNSASNTPHIQVWVNGVVAADFIDNSIAQPNSSQLATGYMGLYDEDAVTNFDDVYVTTPSTSSTTQTAPIAVIGPDQTVNSGTVVTLDGSGSHDADGDALAYSWTQTSGPAVTLSGANTAKASFTAPTVSTNTALQFRLTVTDTAGLTSSAVTTITITPPQTAPIAVIGPDQTVNSGTVVTLDGSGSHDADGDALAYSWTQTSGPAVTLSGANTAKASFTAPTVSTNTALQFRLTVTDTAGLTSSAVTTITITATTTTATNLYDDFEGTPYTMTTDGTLSPNGKWLDVYGGYGLKGVSTETLSTGGTNGYFWQYPKTSTSPGESHSTLTTSTTSFKDFQMTLYMKTVKQLRQNSPPNTWETAWVFWHFTDSYHNYALVLKTNGFQIEKKDNNVKCDCEIFLQTTSTPTVHLGQWQKLTLKVTNSASNTPHIQVWVDGVIAADFVDNSIHQPNSSQLASGHMGLYDEDSVTNFDDVYVTPLS
jgi:hypothetical protein